MLGIVLQVPIEGAPGFIGGDDRYRYRFEYQDCSDGIVPEVNSKVEFTSDDKGVWAYNVGLASGQAIASRGQKKEVGLEPVQSNYSNEFGQSVLHSENNGLGRFLGHAAAFAILYLIFMAPTYILPLLGSKSYLLSAAVGSMNPLFWLHLLCVLVLVLIALFRGLLIGKKWLIIFPLLALVFDLVPGFNFVPLVPTFLHLATMIIGVVGSQSQQKQLTKNS